MDFRLAAAVLALSAPATAQTIDPAATTAALCVSGYSGTVRPAYWITAKVKLAKLQAAGMGWDDAPMYQLDHTIPICLGGHPSDPGNMALMLWDEAKRKDRLEAKLCCMACSGQLQLAEAQSMIATDWEAAYHIVAKIKCRRESGHE